MKDKNLRVDTVIVGAGIVGLAIAREIAKRETEVIILEQHSRAGEETSSRNSGVIHSGIYYPTGSNKALLCVQGNKLLYEYAEQRGINHRNTGKIVVANSKEQIKQLEALYTKGEDNGVEGLELLSRQSIAEYNSEIVSEMGLFCPSSGIIDTAELVQALEAELQEYDVLTSFNSKVEYIEYLGPSHFRITVQSKERYSFEANNIINASGLGAVELANKVEALDQSLIPKAYLAKGHYFQLSGKNPFGDCLIYPLNNKDSLGVHVSIDFSGKARFGPDLTWVDKKDYSFDNSLKEKFVEAIHSYWPSLDPDKLIPDYTGIRPKIYGPKEEPADFIIQSSSDHGIDGLVNLFGIESPGLTSSFAIAKAVVQKLT